MEYEIIADELVKKGFRLNSFGSPEVITKDLTINFVQHPFYHVVSYFGNYTGGRSIVAPWEIKLPLKCSLDDVMFVIDSLIEGRSENEIVIEIMKRFNPEDPASKTEVVRKVDKSENKVKFEINKFIGSLSLSAKGWRKELNLMSWNDMEPKYDIREWSPEHEKMGKGITLSKEELIALREILNGMEL